MNKEATLNIYELKCKINCDLALGKITKKQKEDLINYLELDRKEENYSEKSEANFIKELHELFRKWGLMLYVDGMSNNGRIELISNDILKNRFYFPTGLNYLEEKEILFLPKINKRRKEFEKIKLNENVHIDDIRPILKEITNVDTSSILYKTDKEFSEMCEALKAKYNLY